MRGKQRSRKVEVLEASTQTALDEAIRAFVERKGVVLRDVDYNESTEASARASRRAKYATRQVHSKRARVIRVAAQGKR